MLEYRLILYTLSKTILPWFCSTKLGNWHFLNNRSYHQNPDFISLYFGIVKPDFRYRTFIHLCHQSSSHLSITSHLRIQINTKMNKGGT